MSDDEKKNPMNWLPHHKRNMNEVESRQRIKVKPIIIVAILLNQNIWFLAKTLQIHKIYHKKIKYFYMKGVVYSFSLEVFLIFSKNTSFLFEIWLCLTLNFYSIPFFYPKTTKFTLFVVSKPPPKTTFVVVAVASTATMKNDHSVWNLFEKYFNFFSIQYISYSYHIQQNE